MARQATISARIFNYDGSTLTFIELPDANGPKLAARHFTATVDDVTFPDQYIGPKQQYFADTNELLGEHVTLTVEGEMVMCVEMTELKVFYDQQTMAWVASEEAKIKTNTFAGQHLLMKHLATLGKNFSQVHRERQPYLLPDYARVTKLLLSKLAIDDKLIANIRGSLDTGHKSHWHDRFLFYASSKLTFGKLLGLRHMIGMAVTTMNGWKNIIPNRNELIPDDRQIMWHIMGEGQTWLKKHAPTYLPEVSYDK